MTTKTRNLLEREWSSYVRAVKLEHAPSIQMQECRRAFYAGAAGFFHALSLALDPNSEVTTRDLEIAADALSELQEFGHFVGTPNEGNRQEPQ